jgi:choline dehydrogenase
MLQDIWRYRSFETPTKMAHGIGALKELPNEVKNLKLNHPLVVTDPGVVKAGLLDKVKAVLDDAGVKYTVYDQVEPNPSVETVHKAADAYRQAGADGLIAVGGGSAMDTAKGVGVVVTHPGSILDYEYGKKEIVNRIAPLIAIPTTAGTGSEVTLWAVITDHEREYKFNVGGPNIGAHVALIDPELHVSMPAWVTAATGVDAFCHAYECYTCHYAQPPTEAVALYAMEIAAQNLRTAFSSGQNMIARYNMAMAAMLGGLAYGSESAGAVHAMAQTLGGMYPKTAHGLVVAAILPKVAAFNWQGDPAKHRRVAQAIGIDTTGKSDREVGLAVAGWLEDLNEELQIPSLVEQGVRPDDVERLAKAAEADPQTIGNVRDVTVKDYERMYTELLAG